MSKKMKIQNSVLVSASTQHDDDGIFRILDSWGGAPRWAAGLLRPTAFSEIFLEKSPNFFINTAFGKHQMYFNVVQWLALRLGGSLPAFVAW